MKKITVKTLGNHVEWILEKAIQATIISPQLSLILHKCRFRHFHMGSGITAGVGSTITPDLWCLRNGQLLTTLAHGVRGKDRFRGIDSSPAAYLRHFPFNSMQGMTSSCFPSSNRTLSHCGIWRSLAQ